MEKKNEEKLYEILSSVDEQLKIQNSPKRVFLKGLVRGLGTALGATVLVAVVTSIAFNLAGTIDIGAAIQQFFNSAFSG
ncbi:hypothetical protein GW943_00375 [Candidatus Parcubacteria bacterium]|uniref:Uncharacterized protein n=1 Tax=Candidatus Kaiserbacteria bacterium CG10_big_fil_rev_8_21_14_0_10_47_16 TaxID=1974608 RepID=A0A2H0UD30_9BACT|nr:hypothetical protein [Candidatus Parcubacteria bacterium]PIR84301.1 MAG: hypothetical protein COU16_01760 [Candidatus Kaiserbacteria bacterium CG10_big_fil_rev_8_21_14_0_10_47_16]